MLEPFVQVASTWDQDQFFVIADAQPETRLSQCHLASGTDPGLSKNISR